MQRKKHQPIKKRKKHHISTGTCKGETFVKWYENETGGISCREFSRNDLQPTNSSKNLRNYNRIAIENYRNLVNKNAVAAQPLNQKCGKESYTMNGDYLQAFVPRIVIDPLLSLKEGNLDRRPSWSSDILSGDVGPQASPVSSNFSDASTELLKVDSRLPSGASTPCTSISDDSTLNFSGSNLDESVSEFVTSEDCSQVKLFSTSKRGVHSVEFDASGNGDLSDVEVGSTFTSLRPCSAASRWIRFITSKLFRV